MGPIVTIMPVPPGSSLERRGPQAALRDAQQHGGSTAIMQGPPGIEQRRATIRAAQ